MHTSPAKRLNYENVLFLAIGGYNRTYGLLLEMGLKKEQIATFDNLNLTLNFLEQSHGREVVYISRINYVTSGKQFNEATRRVLDLKVADNFEESMMVYSKATRTIGKGKNEVKWAKPSVVILDDPSLNLQFGGHRFKYQQNLGFVQIANKYAKPNDILKEIENVEETERLMFALYQEVGVDEESIKTALNKLEIGASRSKDDKDYFKPTEYKKIIESNEIANHLKNVDELGIKQLKSNARLDGEIARWVIVPHEAYDFKGFVFKDEEDLFQEELAAEEQKEREFERVQQKKLEELLSEEIDLNVRVGYTTNHLGNSGKETLKNFVEAADEANKKTEAVKLLADASSSEEYQAIKKNNVIYFIDGRYENDERLDKNYRGGKKLIPIDVDDHDYKREELEERLEEQGLFGIIYPTTRYYFDGSLRWRILLLADQEFTKETYKYTVRGVANMLGIEIDKASEKLSQLAGYPFKEEDISFVVGSKVNVEQFQPKPKGENINLYQFPAPHLSNKSLVDYNHDQAKDLKRALSEGIPEGERNETYYGIMQYLNDTLNNPAFQTKHDEAAELVDRVQERMRMDGLDEKEIEQICRQENSQEH